MIKKKMKLIIASSILFIILVPSFAYGYSYHSFQTKLNHAETLLSNEQYDDSVTAFLNLKPSKFSDVSSINSKVKLALELKQSKEAFTAAMKLFDEKKYVEAINSFKTVKKLDKSRYAKANKKIKEASTIYVTNNIAKAKSEAYNTKYEVAIGFLDTVLKFDKNNKEAISLKNTYNTEIQKIRDEESKQKQSEEYAESRTKETNSNDQTASHISQKQLSNSNETISTNISSASVDNPGYTITSYNGWFQVHLNSGVQTPEGFGIKIIMYDLQPYGIDYMFVGNDVHYEITFHLPTGDIKKSGIASNNICSVPATPTDVPKNQAINIDISAIYKGKTYTGSFSKVINTVS